MVPSGPVNGLRAPSLLQPIRAVRAAHRHFDPAPRTNQSLDLSESEIDPASRERSDRLQSGLDLFTIDFAIAILVGQFEEYQ